jgi:alkanesulfonate monooxygenase SsuD/methylene tetrahydromethanopterin reductase-like flavin-dependent oxidoreductase (luciferase family)
MIATQCDAYVMHGDAPEVIAAKIADMTARRDAAGKPAMTYGMAAYAIVRDTEEEARPRWPHHHARPEARRASPTSTNGSPAPSWSAR